MKNEIMIIDYNKCIRVAYGDEQWMRGTTPYRCPECGHGVNSDTGPRSLTFQTRSGRLRFDGDPTPQCEDHKIPLDMVPVK